jgi:hypothetical protein
MKEKVEDKAKSKKRKTDDTVSGESSNQREQLHKERSNDSNEKDVSANRKIIDRVRRGYPDGPGGSYDGF